MGIELVIFIAAILFGIFLYWRESDGNGAYRLLNKVVNSKELQMESNDPRGFVYKQAFIPRLIFVVTLVIIAALVLEFLTPISVFGSYNGISAFASFAVGTLLGTYLASFVIKTTKVVEEKGGSIGEVIEEAVDKGKELLEDLKPQESAENETSNPEKQPEMKTEEQQKSARDRLKDKGLM
jgi:hypothetical protein